MLPVMWDDLVFYVTMLCMAESNRFADTQIETVSLLHENMCIMGVQIVDEFTIEIKYANRNQALDHPRHIWLFALRRIRCRKYNISFRIRRELRIDLTKSIPMHFVTR